MALIYKIKFPPNPLTTINNESFGGWSGASNTALGSNNSLYFTDGYRDFYPPIGQIIVPNQDISSKDFKVSTKLDEINSKITYGISFVGETAKQFIQYIKFIRLPDGDDAYPKPTQGLEYLFNLDKQVGIVIQDDCCNVVVDGRTEKKTVLTGFIPLNTIRYCEDTCSVNCTIYEDGARTNALKCFESTVLGLRSTVGILQTGEYYTDVNYEQQTGNDYSTAFAGQQGKWFDVCIEPQSTGIPLLLANFLGYFKIIITTVLTPIITAIVVIQFIVNIIITAINIIPGVDVPLLEIVDIDDSVLNIVDDIFSLERVIEGLFGCKYVRGSYRVANIITTACSICGLSKEEVKDFYIRNPYLATANAEMPNIIVPITPNPFVSNGSMTASISNKLDTYNTAYMPAEEAYKRKKEEKIRYTDDAGPSRNRDIAIRGASIETTDKIFDRLSSLWGNSWNVVNVPKENGSKGLQLQLGQTDGRYAFGYGSWTDSLGVDKYASTFIAIEDMKVCYKVSEGSPIGYSTTWQQDSADIPANKQLANHKGYITYFFSSLKDRKTKNVKDYNVQFAPAHYIRSLKDDSIYDDLASGREPIVGFIQLDEFFETGTLIQGSEFTGVPKLIKFTVVPTNVLERGVTCRVADYNDKFSASYRMSSIVDTELASSSNNTAILTPRTGASNITLTTGIQTLLPHYTVGYFGKLNIIPGIYTDLDIDNLIQDYLNKYSSEEVGYSEAASIVRGDNYSFLGPFNNLTDERTIPIDNPGYKFSPLMEFSITLENYKCGDEDLFNQCVTEAVVKSGTILDDTEQAYKLRLVKLRLGLGVVTELEIDYVNRKIEASGYVIPFWQNGVDYSKI